MRKLLLLLVLLVPLTLSAHSVTLSWTASTDSGVTYNIYRATGVCPVSGIPAQATEMATGITITSWTDTTVIWKQTYCYYATATKSGKESIPSNNAQVGLIPVTMNGVSKISGAKIGQ